MGKWSRNVEGYADITAGIAIERVSREERKIVMAKINEIGNVRGIGATKMEGIQAILEKHLGVWTNV